MARVGRPIVIELMAGAVISAVAYAVGRQTGKRERKATMAAVCPCGHAIGFHETMTGRCHGVNMRTEYNKHSEGIGAQPVKCTCQHYSGPELISSLTLRPVAARPTTELEP